VISPRPYPPEPETECQHPDGVDDRMLCVLYRSDVDAGPLLLVPQVAALHSLRRSLVAELRSADPDHGEVDALSLAMLDAVREAPGGSPGPSERPAEGPVVAGIRSGV
jgi:hypothetical protein